MAVDNSFLAKRGLRTGFPGSFSDLALAFGQFPENNVDPHTASNRVGWYYDLTPSAEVMAAVVGGIPGLKQTSNGTVVTFQLPGLSTGYVKSDASGNLSYSAGIAAGDITSGTIDPARLPPIALTTIQVVADQAARLALSNVEPGDAVKETSTGQTFILQTLPASVNANWVQISDITPDWSTITGIPSDIASLGSLSGTGVVVRDSVGTLTARALTSTDIPNLPATKLTTGLLPSQRLVATDAVGWLKNDGAGGLSWTGITKTDVGLGNVVNVDQTNASNLSSGLVSRAVGGTGLASPTGYIKFAGASAPTTSATIPGADISGNISGNAANVTGTVAVANGGTGATTLTGYLKGSGTSPITASATIPGADIAGNIPGNAANVTGTVLVANGGTGATTLTGYVKGSGTSAFTASATIPGADIAGNIAGNAANVTGIVALANGGTGKNNSAPTDGQFLIGSGGLFTTGNIQAGSNISITYGAGTITINNASGTVNPMTTLGDTIYGAAGGVVTRLPGSTAATPRVLMQTGTGAVSAAPTWFDLFGTNNAWTNQTFNSYVDFTAMTAPTGAAGRTWYDSDTNAIAYHNGAVTVHVGQENVALVRNSTGSTINAGKAVYISGATGSQALISLASNTTYNSSQTIGLMSATVLNNGQSYAVTSGLCHSIDTSAYVDGDVLWLGTSGNLTTTRPSDPTRQVRIGYVLRAHATQGKILVSIQLMDSLDGLSDVQVTSPSTKQTLVWDGTKWVNQSALDTAVYYVDAYNAAGDGVTDDTTPVNNCIAAAPAGSTVKFTGGKTYLVRSLVDITKTLIIDGGGAQILCDVTNSGSSGSPLFPFQGSAGTSYAASPIAVGANTVTLTTVGSGSNFEVGDIVRLNSSTNQAQWWNGAAGSIASQALHQVVAVVGDVLTVSPPTHIPYPASATVSKLTLVQNPVVRNFQKITEVYAGSAASVTSPSPDIISFRYCQNAVVEDTMIDGFGAEAVKFLYVYGGSVLRVTAQDAFNPQVGGIGNLAQISYSRYITVRDCRGYNVRHVIDYDSAWDCVSYGNFGSSSTPDSTASIYTTHGSGCCRIVSIGDSAEGESGWFIGRAAQSPDFDIIISGFKFIASPTAYSAVIITGGSSGVTVTDSNIRYAGSYSGSLVAVRAENGARDVSVMDNVIDLSQVTGAPTAVMAMSAVTNVISTVTYTCSDLYVRNNRVVVPSGYVAFDLDTAGRFVFDGNNVTGGVGLYGFNVAQPASALVANNSFKLLGTPLGAVRLGTGGATTGPSEALVVTNNHVSGAFSGQAVVVHATGSTPAAGVKITNNRAASGGTVLGLVSGTVSALVNSGARVEGNDNATDIHRLSSDVRVYGAAGTTRGFSFYSGTSLRALMGLNSVAESGSSVGSDFTLSLYDDAGALVDTPLTIERPTTGLIRFSRRNTLFGSSSISDTFFEIRSQLNTNATLQFSAGSTARWVIRKDNSTESGSDVGSNFGITAYTDAGAQVDTPFIITRAANGAIYLQRVQVVAGSSAGTSMTLDIRTAANSSNQIQLCSGTAGRWVIRKNSTTEAGSNAGADLEILARTDAGGAIDTPLVITRAATGTFTIQRPVRITPTAVSAGPSTTALLLTGAANTNLTASTEVPDVNLNLARTVQWATGALTTQRAVRIQAPTYAFVGASTITTAATVSIGGAPVAGTNATITNAYALLVESGNVQLTTGNLTVSAGTITGNGSGLTTLNATNLSSGTVPAARMPALTGDVTTTAGAVATTITAGAVTLAKMADLAANSIIGNNTGSAATPLALTAAQVKTLLAITTSDVSGSITGTGAASRIAYWSGTSALTSSANFSYDGITLSVAQTAQTSGVARLLTLTGAAHTARTASTEAVDVYVNLARTVQWATGALANQRAMYILAPTYSFVAASTLTTAATLAISGAPVAGTNATITNAYALNIESGNLNLATGGLRFAGTDLFARANTWTATQQLTLSASGSGMLFNRATDAVQYDLNFLTNGGNRWIVRFSTAESGANAGGDLALIRRDDAGANIGTVVRFIRSSGQVELDLGTAALPSLTFAGRLDTGIYSPAADTVGLACNGVRAAQFTSAAGQGWGSIYSVTDTANSGPALHLIRSRVSGTNGQVQSGDRLGELRALGTDDTGAQATSGMLMFSASESHTATAKGAYADLLLIADTTTSLLSKFRFYGDGGVRFGSILTASPGFGVLTSSVAVLAGATARIGSETFRAAGGTDAQPSLTDVTIADGRVNAGRQLKIGAIAQPTVGSMNQRLTLTMTDAANAGVQLAHFAGTTASNCPSLYFARSRSTTALGTAVTSGDRLMDIRAYGDDGTAFTAATTIMSEVDGTVSTGVVPGRLRFFTADSGGTLREGWRIDSAQALIGFSTTDSTAIGVGSAQLAGGLSVAKNISALTIRTSEYTVVGGSFGNPSTTNKAWVTIPAGFHGKIVVTQRRSVDDTAVGSIMTVEEYWVGFTDAGTNASFAVYAKIGGNGGAKPSSIYYDSVSQTATLFLDSAVANTTNCLVYFYGLNSLGAAPTFTNNQSAAPAGTLQTVASVANALLGSAAFGTSFTTNNGIVQLPAGTTIATGGLAWGTDAGIWRQAAGVLTHNAQGTATNPVFRLARTSGSTLDLFTTTSGGYVAVTNTDNLVLQTNSVDRLIISGTGGFVSAINTVLVSDRSSMSSTANSLQAFQILNDLVAPLTIQISGSSATVPNLCEIVSDGPISLAAVGTLNLTATGGAAVLKATGSNTVTLNTNANDVLIARADKLIELYAAQTASGTLLRWVTQPAAANSATPTTTTFSPTLSGNGSIPANRLVTGSVIRVLARGTFATDATANRQFTLSFVIGGVTVSVQTFADLPASATGVGFVAEACFTLTGTGASVSAVGSAWMVYSTSTTTGACSLRYSSTNSITLNTTASISFSANTTWAAANATCVVTMRSLELLVS